MRIARIHHFFDTDCTFITIMQEGWYKKLDAKISK